MPESRECVGYEVQHSKGLLQRTFAVDDEIAEKYRDWSEPVQFRFETTKATGELMLVMRRV